MNFVTLTVSAVSALIKLQNLHHHEKHGIVTLSSFVSFGFKMTYGICACDFWDFMCCSYQVFINIHHPDTYKLMSKC